MEHGPGPGWAEAIEASTLAVRMRQSFVLYHFANTAHVLGIALLVGSIVALDLRLLGFGRTLPLEAASRFLTRLTITGLLIAVPTGLMMFSADATALLSNIPFRTKAVLIALALANAIAWRSLWSERLSDWDVAPPRVGRLQAAASILLWCAVVTAGRLIAYL
jgi:Family of unknown function (DUF6644)